MELPRIYSVNNLLFPQSSSSNLAYPPQRWAFGAIKPLRTETGVRRSKEFLVRSPVVVKHQRDIRQSLDIPTLEILNHEAQNGSLEIPTLDNVGSELQNGSLSEKRFQDVAKDCKKYIIKGRENFKSMPVIDPKVIEEALKQSNVVSQNDYKESSIKLRAKISRPPSSSGRVLQFRSVERTSENREDQPKSESIRKVSFGTEVKENNGSSFTSSTRNFNQAALKTEVKENESPKSPMGILKPRSKSVQKPTEDTESDIQSPSIKKVTFAAGVKETDGQGRMKKRKQTKAAKMILSTPDEDLAQIERPKCDDFTENLKLTFEPFLSPFSINQNLKSELTPRKVSSLADSSSSGFPLALPPIKTDYEILKLNIFKTNQLAPSPQERGTSSSRERLNNNLLSPKWASENYGSGSTRPSIFKKNGSLSSLWPKPKNLA